MGAQAAAALAGDGPLGQVPPPFRPAGRLVLAGPPGYVLDRVARAHGGVGLAPTWYDGRTLGLRLPGPVRVDGDLVVTWADQPPDPAVLRDVLALDDDLGDLWDACDRLPDLAWVRPAGAGRLLRSPTVWQDLVGLLASTRTSYRSTQAMLRGLVRDGPFPTPGEVARLREEDLRGWGYRSGALLALARAVDLGQVDPQSWRDPVLPDAQVSEAVRALRGFGPFSAASLLPLLGRPRPLVLDGWLRDRLSARHGPLTSEQVRRRYAPLGRWAGTGLWLDVTGAGRPRAV